jgi:hypothetical protein
MKTENFSQERVDEYQQNNPDPCEGCLLMNNCSERCNPSLGYEVCKVFYAWRPTYGDGSWQRT